MIRSSQEGAQMLSLGLLSAMSLYTANAHAQGAWQNFDVMVVVVMGIVLGVSINYERRYTLMTFMSLGVGYLLASLAAGGLIG